MVKSPKPAGLYGGGGGRYRIKYSPDIDRVLCEIQGVERRLSNAATWERAERLREGKGKIANDGVHKLCSFASLEATVAPNVVRRHSTGAGKQRPPAVVALVADQQGENLDGLLLGAAATFM